MTAENTISYWSNKDKHTNSSHRQL